MGRARALLMGERVISLLLVDEQELFLDALHSLLAREPRVRVVGQARNGHQALTSARRVRPDVVVMDLSFPDVAAADLIARIRHSHGLESTRVLILSTSEDVGLVQACLTAGASGYVGKNGATVSLLDAIQSVHAGEVPLSPRIAGGLLQLIAGPSQPPPLIDSGQALLTSREIEIVGLAGRGLNNEEIGRRLSVSASTAKTHVRNAMRKLSVHDRAQLVALAHRLKIASPQ